MPLMTSMGKFNRAENEENGKLSVFSNPANATTFLQIFPNQNESLLILT